MRLEIWTDVVCPWCGLGQARLDKALAAFDHADEVEIVHRAFQLDPSFPPGETRSVREVLSQKYGLDADSLAASGARIEALAEAEGMSPYNALDNVMGNTSKAHQLALFAQDEGLGHAAWQALYQAYFGSQRDVFSVDSLVALGEEVGLDPAQVRDTLTSGRLAHRVAQDQETARQLGATGVPFVVLDRRLAVAGAQPVETFLGALDQAWAGRSAAPSAGDSCSAEGCEP